MDLQDTSVSIHPYLKISDENLEAFKAIAEDFIETTRGEMGCLYYGWSFINNKAFCREGYINADAVLAHLSNVEDLLERMRKLAEITQFEVHGPAQELLKLKSVLEKFNPEFFILEGGFRN